LKQTAPVGAASETRSIKMGLGNYDGYLAICIGNLIDCPPNSRSGFFDSFTSGCYIDVAGSKAEHDHHPCFGGQLAKKVGRAIGRYLLAKRRRHELVDQPPAVVYWNAIQPDQQAKKVA